MDLLPTSFKIYDEFWATIKRYNQWFIKLRFWAVASLILFYFFIRFVLGLELSEIQDKVIISITGLILIYNSLFMRIHKNNSYSQNKVNELRLELYQMFFDLFSLSILVYFLGGIEAPIFLFFIFHMIIGSLILPVLIMYLIAGTLIVFFSLFSFLELSGIIPHMAVKGLYNHHFYNDLNFVVGFIFIFSFMLFFCIYLTSKIVQELYAREGHLKNALDQLNEAEASKQKYIMAVVHELKSPIAAASSFLDLVIGGYAGSLDESAKDKIVKARRRTEESIETINNILRVSKFRLMNKLEVESIDIIKLIQKIVDSIKPVADRKNILISLVTKGIHTKISGDSVLLNLAFSNLISNSVKYTPKDGQVDVVIIFDKQKCIIKVIDDGIGIPKVDQDKIFEEFYRASNAKAKNIEGTGTGLNVVKQVVESHKGKLELFSPSEIEKNDRPGTEFRITIDI
ncbi:MAG: HAMP domain-containing histidine kinase [Bacteroidetes bacterium]|nr:HAMP domain-containing histidine kinase [Bacteroidota bacterium]